MPEPSVQCGCGRKMTLDTLRGKGAFRCGCGVRIKVTEAPAFKGGCAVHGCAFGAVESDPVVGVCYEHRRKLILSMVPLVYAKHPPEKWRETSTKYEAEFGPIEMPTWATMPLPALPTVRGRNHKPVVYFIVLDDKVKIGTTKNMTRRLGEMSLPPNARVEITTPGDHNEERRLHSKFARHRHGTSEWFTLSPEIRRYIDGLREAQG